VRVQFGPVPFDEIRKIRRIAGERVA